MTICYKYNSKEDYVYHVKELMKIGLEWINSDSEEEYAPYYDEYDKFVLFVEEDCEHGQLSYGHEGWVESYMEYKLYTRKKSNIDSY